MNNLPKWAKSEKSTIREWWISTEKGTYSNSIQTLGLWEETRTLLAIAIVQKFDLLVDKDCETALRLTENKICYPCTFKEQSELYKTTEKLVQILRSNNCEKYNLIFNCYAIGDNLLNSVMLSRICISYSRDSMKVKRDVLIEQAKMVYLTVAPSFVVESKYKTPTVKTLALQIYDNKDWGTMPILADALEDAGYASEQALLKLRDPKSYWFRGCRILEEILNSN